MCIGCSYTHTIFPCAENETLARSWDLKVVRNHSSTDKGTNRQSGWPNAAPLLGFVVLQDPLESFWESALNCKVYYDYLGRSFTPGGSWTTYYSILDYQS